MFNHIVIGTNDIERAQAFYDPLLAILGVAPGVVDKLPGGSSRLFYRHGGLSFVITEPLDGNPATVANGSTIAFRCDGPDQVRQFHDTAVSRGGTSIEDTPGIRRNPMVGDIYAAYVRDTDGNKLCATHREMRR